MNVLQPRIYRILVVTINETHKLNILVLRCSFQDTDSCSSPTYAHIRNIEHCN